MAKSTSRRRDGSIIANRGLSVFRQQPLLPFDMSQLRPIEDRRTFHPQGETRSARSFRSAHHRLVARPEAPSVLVQRPYHVGHAVAFDAPRDVLVCVRRQSRREVLHALRKTGKTGQKRPRRSFFSSISCKGK